MQFTLEPPLQFGGHGVPKRFRLLLRGVWDPSLAEALETIVAFFSGCLLKIAEGCWLQDDLSDPRFSLEDQRAYPALLVRDEYRAIRADALQARKYGGRP